MMYILGYGRGKFLVGWLSSLVLFSVLLSNLAVAKSYDYNVLRMKDLEVLQKEISVILKARPKLPGASARTRSQLEAEGIERLREALTMILSRPNYDNLLASLLPPLRSELKNYNAFDETLISLVGESLYTLKHSKRQTNHQISMLFLIENIMAEIKPKVVEKAEFKRLLVRIKEANIKLSKSIVHELKFKRMIKAVSPSVTAGNILKQKKL